MTTTRLLLLLICLTAGQGLMAQIQVNVSTPLMPDLDLNQTRHEIKNQFKKLKKDSIEALDRRAKYLKQQLEQLPEDTTQLHAPDSLALRIDSAQWNPDALYKAVSENELVKENLQQELDSINHLKQAIQWDSLQEEYLVTEMQRYFQSKGLLPTPSASEDPVKDLQQQLASDLPSMHLDPESFKTKEALSREAAKQLTKLKSKYLKMDDLRYPENGIEKPKPYNSFTDRILVGGQLHIDLRSQATVDFKPNLGIIIAPGLRWSMDYSANYFMRPRMVFLERNEEISRKVGTFLNADVLKGFFVRAKAEKKLDTPLSSFRDLDYYTGLGKTFTLYKGLKSQLVLNYAFQLNEKGRRWSLEYGIRQEGISNLWKKKKQ